MASAALCHTDFLVRELPDVFSVVHSSLDTRALGRPMRSGLV
jgi:hypothetical protein